MMSDHCRYLFGDVVLFLNVFGEVRLVWGRVSLGRHSVGKCSVMSGYCRDVFGEVGL